MEKRTDKIKKLSYGGFYSNFAKWNSKGKSSKEKDAMIADLKDCITHQLVRIKKLKYVITLVKEDRDRRIEIDEVKLMRHNLQKKVINEKNKVSTRDKNLEVREKNVEALELSLKENNRLINKLLRESAKKDETIVDLKQATKKVETKIVEKPLSKEAIKIEKFAETPLNERITNIVEFSIKFAKFSEERQLAPNLINILLQISQMKFAKFSNLWVGATRTGLTRLVAEGYLAVQLTKQVKNYFLTAKGKTFVEDCKNYISYSKLVK